MVVNGGLRRVVINSLSSTVVFSSLLEFQYEEEERASKYILSSSLPGFSLSPLGHVINSGLLLRRCRVVVAVDTDECEAVLVARLFLLRYSGCWLSSFNTLPEGATRRMTPTIARVVIITVLRGLLLLLCYRKCEAQNSSEGRSE